MIFLPKALFQELKLIVHVMLLLIVTPFKCFDSEVDKHVPTEKRTYCIPK